MHDKDRRHYEQVTGEAVAPLLRDFAKHFTNESRNLLEDAAALIETRRPTLAVDGIDTFERPVIDPGTDDYPGSYYLCNRGGSPVAIINVFQFSNGLVSMDVIPGTGLREKAAAMPTKFTQAIIFRAMGAGRVDMDVPADAAIVNVTIGTSTEPVKYTDIADVPDKRAVTLTQMDGTDNPYNEAIRASAQLMMDVGRDQWLYSTQYSSGTTVWRRDQEGTRVCTVSKENGVKD